jgi:hypothetical protein
VQQVQPNKAGIKAAVHYRIPISNSVDTLRA